MRVRDISMGYTAYVLDDASRQLLAKQFPPKYPKFIGHHVTVKFGVPKDAAPPPPAKVTVVGYADSGDGLEALIVTINGLTEREDGSVFHITWSLDPTKYKPKDSNGLVKGVQHHQFDDIVINAVPATL